MTQFIAHWSSLFTIAFSLLMSISMAKEIVDDFLSHELARLESILKDFLRVGGGW